MLYDRYVRQDETRSCHRGQVSLGASNSRESDTGQSSISRSRAHQERAHCFKNEDHDAFCAVGIAPPSSSLLILLQGLVEGRCCYGGHLAVL